MPLRQTVLKNQQTATSLPEQQEQAVIWFRTLRNRICSVFEQIEDESLDCAAPGRFERKTWDRPGGGGGEIALMKGRVFEKVGVNISTVHGHFSKEFQDKIPGSADSDGAFWAAGVSLVAHMRSPLVPAIHMNTRMIVTSKAWFGGGTDLNPMVEDAQRYRRFSHGALKACCDRHDLAYYPEIQAMV